MSRDKKRTAKAVRKTTEFKTARRNKLILQRIEERAFIERMGH